MLKHCSEESLARSLTPKPSQFLLATSTSQNTRHAASEPPHCQALAQHGGSNLHITWSDQWIASCLITPFDLSTESTRWAFDCIRVGPRRIGTGEEALTRRVLGYFFLWLFNELLADESDLAASQCCRSCELSPLWKPSRLALHVARMQVSRVEIYLGLIHGVLPLRDRDKLHCSVEKKNKQKQTSCDKKKSRGRRLLPKFFFYQDKILDWQYGGTAKVS